MSKLLSKYRNFLCNIHKSTWYQFKVSRNIALPDIQFSMPDTCMDYDVLRPWRGHAACASAHESMLAGDPQRTILFQREIREDVLIKWNQRPKPDLQREWVKYAIYY